MESSALQDFLDWAEENTLLQKIKVVCCDRDSSTHKLVKDDPRYGLFLRSIAYRSHYCSCAHLELVFDPGHVKKGFQKSLMKLFGKRKMYKLFPSRIANWMMRSLCEAKALFPADRAKLQAEFCRRMAFLIPHYTAKTCDDKCPCNSFKDTVVPAKFVVDHPFLPAFRIMSRYLGDRDLASAAVTCHHMNFLAQDALADLEKKGNKSVLSADDSHLPELKSLVWSNHDCFLLLI